MQTLPDDELRENLSLTDGEAGIDNESASPGTFLEKAGTAFAHGCKKTVWNTQEER